MKNYEFPQLNVKAFDVEDVICESSNGLENGGQGGDSSGTTVPVNPSNPDDIFGTNSTGVSAFN